MSLKATQIWIDAGFPNQAAEHSVHRAPRLPRLRVMEYGRAGALCGIPRQFICRYTSSLSEFDDESDFEFFGSPTPTPEPVARGRGRGRPRGHGRGRGIAQVRQMALHPDINARNGRVRGEREAHRNLYRQDLGDGMIERNNCSRCDVRCTNCGEALVS